MKYIKYIALLTLVLIITAGCSKSGESSENGSQPKRTTSFSDTTESGSNTDFADTLLDDAYEVKYFKYDYEPWGENITSEVSFSKDEIIERDVYYSVVLYDIRMHPTAQFIYYSRPSRPADISIILIFTTDDRGLILSINYFDMNGEPMASSSTRDYHRIVYTYDASKNRTSKSGYGINRKPVKHYSTAHRIEWKYNGNGNCISENYYDINGKPVNADFESCRIEWKYDENGNCTSESGYGTNGERAGYNYSLHRTEWDYDEDGNWVSRSYYDDDGKPMESMLGNCRFDAGDDGGFAVGYKTIREFDENGWVVSERYFDVDSQPFLCCYGGAHEVRLTYDAAGNVLSDSYYGLNREPISVENYPKDGHLRKYKYRVIEGETVLVERAFFGVNGEPFAGSNGIHRYVEKYPEGLDGKTIKTKYDVNGNVIHDD